MGMVARVTTNFGPFCSKDFSSGVSSFLERLITHVSWILGNVEGVTEFWKCWISWKPSWRLLCRLWRWGAWTSWFRCSCNVGMFSLCYWRFQSVDLWRLVHLVSVVDGVLVLAISVWRWLILILVNLILLWMSECSASFIMACSKSFPFHLICKVFGVTLFVRHLRLKILAVLDLAGCLSDF